MIPTNDGSTQPCSPISSNCVVWQGPDIACIDICNGDTVSDVVAALATKLCDLIDQACTCDPDLTGLDLKCALPAIPPTNLVGTMQAIVDYICEINPPSTAPNPVQLPQCLQYKDKLGNPVSELSMDEWATLISNQICTLINSVSILNQSMLNLESRVALLEECVLPCQQAKEADFGVISSCINPGVEIPISTLVLALETEFCNLRSAVGSVPLIQQAINAQCLFASSAQLGGNEGTLGNLSGWVNSPSTLAEINVNQWLIICDLYTAVSAIQDNCCDSACSAVNILYTYNVIEDASGIPTTLNVKFTASTIPSGYLDCNGNSLITITDANGTVQDQAVSIAGLSGDNNGVNIPLSSLNVYESIILTVASCLTNGTNQCQDTSSVIIPLEIPCPQGITVSAAVSTISVNFLNTLGSSVNYVITAFDASNPSAILGTTTISSPGTNIAHIFTGAQPGVTYTVQVKVQLGSGVSICPSQDITIGGSLCTSTSTTLTSVTPAVDDIFIGFTGDLATSTGIQLSLHVDNTGNSANDRIVIESGLSSATYCYAPILSSLVANSVSPGDIDGTANWGNTAETSIVISYSTDDIAYTTGQTLLPAGVPGAFSFNTGVTSGSVYIKAITNCTSGGISVATKWRYDFSTDTWTLMQSPSECQDNPINPDICPAGLRVAQQYLDCEGVQYTLPGAPVESYWYYVGKVVVLGVTKYIYAGWDSAGMRNIVLCCACPAYILSDTIRIFAPTSGSITFNVPYVLGEGEPTISIIQQPVCGTVVQTGTSFEYSHDPTASNPYADTMRLSITPSVSGVCQSSESVIQIQTVPCGVELTYTDQDVYAFINTNTWSSAEGLSIKNGLTALVAQWAIDFSYTGNLYFIPTTDPRWLGYQKSIVDNGASWSPYQSADPIWIGLEDLPTSWPGGSGVGVFKNAALILTFSNHSDGIYHDSTLAAGFTGVIQPSTEYKDDYDAMQDSLNGTSNTTWASSLGITQNQFPIGFGQVLYPMVTPGSGGADAANILQMIAAVTGELIPPSKFGIKTAVNVGQVIQGIGPSNPYNGASTPAGTISDLFSLAGNAGTLALLDQTNTPNLVSFINTGDNEEFNTLLTRSIKGCKDVYPSLPSPVTDVYLVEDCTTGDQYYTLIANQSCGSIGEGTVIKLNNPGATFSPGGGRADWTTLTNKCVIVIDNCNAGPSELGTVLISTHSGCVSCTP